MADKKRMTLSEWQAEGARLFGEGKEHFMEWKFVCPVCGHVQTGNDFKAAGGDPDYVMQGCIGRVLGISNKTTKPPPGGPCDYAAYGLFRLSPITISDEDHADIECFGFYEEPPTAGAPDELAD